MQEIHDANGRFLHKHNVHTAHCSNLAFEIERST